MIIVLTNTSSCYKPPSCNEISRKILDDNFKRNYETILKHLARDVKVYEIMVMWDGATNLKTFFVNIWGSGSYCTSLILNIADCTNHMTEGGFKDV